MKSIEVFISYHQEDETLRQELEKHLASLRRENIITSWNDRKIVAGQEIKGEIDRHLNQAGLILLLISPDFIDSDYHWTIEVTRALEQNATKKARVIPILLRYTDWETPPINQLSPLPSNRKPIKSWNDRDEAFLEVVKGIREAARSVANSNSSPPQQTTPELEERQYQVTSLINEADRLREAKKFEEGAIKYKAALYLDPNSIIAHIHLGNSLYGQEKLEEAIAAYQRALLIDPNYAIAHNNLGIALSDQGKVEEAIAAYQRALLIDPNDADAHYNLGIALYGQEKLEEAIAAYQRALLIDPNDADAHNNLGNALSDQGKLEEAIAAYQRALLIDPNYANAHNNLGIALSDQGKLEEAIAAYQIALRIDPNLASAHNNLGIALYDQGKLEEAIAELEIAVRLNPSNTLIRNNLEIYRNKKKGFWGRLFGG
ncbi:toll/interleukin-1 receptor domain-containing protein [Nostoc sp. ATCC 53789]|uniref:toll/interleukin-1 receptor domain-containing protein n=1 Tax=Nostoc sp. ATCC 53789 TaxID=76335 RepID=UPI001ADA60B4|nr:toll/interleukin-1 receptor domain-containing protein [Nostoc sp. ATCC 53789]